jgi:hypothetical protein
MLGGDPRVQHRTYLRTPHPPDFSLIPI